MLDGFCRAINTQTGMLREENRKLDMILEQNRSLAASKSEARHSHCKKMSPS
ncbi:hypothetical protein CRENBAI_011144 [Crenichthys baileyi]|uniref:Uncharacterized protein n=1 Tax=Crenichthys baileyi TaxID=28760 RepID=A0AAV9S0J3_9TELE